MDISIFLAKALGTYFLILAMAFIINVKALKKIAFDISYNPPLFFITSIIALILGILLVISHNIWVDDWRVTITIISWIVLVKGTIRVVFPDLNYQAMFNFLFNKTAYWILMLVFLTLGAFLSYMGFNNGSMGIP